MNITLTNMTTDESFVIDDELLTDALLQFAEAIQRLASDDDDDTVVLMCGDIIFGVGFDRTPSLAVVQ